MCVFGHGDDNTNTSTASSPSQGTARTDKSSTGKDASKASVEQPGSPKRQRLNHDEPATSSSATKKEQDGTSANTQTSTPNPSKTSNKEDGASKSIQTSNRPISPPPLSRQSKQQTPSTDKAAPTKSKPKPSPSPQTPKQPPPKRPIKAESLNPRLLKFSPASHELRLKLLKMLHNEYKRLNDELERDASKDESRLLLTDQQLITRALDLEEKTALERGSVYSNIMKNAIVQHKRMSPAQWVEIRNGEVPASGKKRPHGDMENGKPTQVDTELSTTQQVKLLHHILTPIDKLAAHGYQSSVPSDEAIAKAQDGVAAAKGWEKCDRCTQRFQVFAGRREEDGALTSGGACNFHWGKAYFPEKAAGDRTRKVKRYLCCGQQVGDSAGCITHPNHVFKASDPKRLAAVLNYAETPENANAPTNRAVCFDCEMGYTVHGMELIRLTATSWPSGEEIIDVLVKPIGEVLDLNSRYSGVWPDDLAQSAAWKPGDPLVPAKSGETSGSEDGEVKPKRNLRVVASPAVARDLLFSQISPSTPLIGHGLENDLNAVRIVHPTLVDTVLAFPHKGGLPYRYSLKSLMEWHLDRKIQQQTGPNMLGHDSAEDARAAGELVKFKLDKKWGDMKRAGWKLENGEVVAPAEKSAAAEDQSGTLTEDFIES